MYHIGFSSSRPEIAGFFAEPERSDPREIAALLADWPKWMIKIDFLTAHHEIKRAE
jgi:hypothetical protein